MTGRKGERGAVLLLVLAVIALLTALLSDWAFSTLVDLRLTETFRDSTRAYYLARGGVSVGRMLLQEDRNSYDGAGELWSIGVPSYPVGEGGVISIAIEDHDGRLDLNRIVDATGRNPTVYRERFRRLLDDLGVADKQALIDALFDWRDYGDNDASEPQGAETAYYQSLTPPYRAKNGPLDTLDELLLVRGYTPELLAMLAPYVTVNNGGRLNLNTASPEVLRCWHADMTASAADALVEARHGEPFKTLDAARGVLGDLFTVLNEQGDLGVTSNVYRITVRAGVNDGQRTAEALVQKGGDRLLFLKVE